MQVAKTVDSHLSTMGAQKLAAVGLGDEDSGTMPDHFQAWAEGILQSQGQAPRATAVANSVESLLSQAPEVTLQLTRL